MRVRLPVTMKAHARSATRNPANSPSAPALARGAWREADARRGGFVLVFVLALILVAGLTTAGFARKSLILSRTVADQRESMQRRWGMRSCQRFALANAAALLDGSSLAEGRELAAWPLAGSIRADVQLGDFQVTLCIADEDAKFNLNGSLLRDPDPRTVVTGAIQQASASSGILPQVRWPTEPAAGMVSGQKRPLFMTWEQVFELHGHHDLRELPARLQAATVELTCWGSGRLNIRRATDDTVRAVCRGHVSDELLARVLSLRRLGGFDSLNALLRRLNPKPAEEAALKRLLTVDSRCYAVWLTAQGPRRSWTSLTIDRSGKGNPAKFETFSW